MNCSPRLAVTLTALAAFSFVGTGAHAQTTTFYNVQFNNGGTTYTGSGAAAGSGTTWNVKSGGASTFTLSSLKDSNGAASALSLSVTTTGGYFITNGASTANTPAALLTQYLIQAPATATPGTFTFSGLDTSAPVSLYLYDADAPYNDRKATFSLTNSTFATPTTSRQHHRREWQQLCHSPKLCGAFRHNRCQRQIVWDISRRAKKWLR